MPSFIQFLPVFYHLGVTDLRPFFTQKIDHISINLNQIPTKIGTEICFNRLFMCTKFVRCTTQPSFTSSAASQAGVAAAAGEEAKDNHYLETVSDHGSEFIP